MNFILAFITSLIMIGLSYIFVKTYQLCGYKMGAFWDNVIKMSLSFGDKNSLKFTKRIIRFIICLFLLGSGITLLILTFVNNGFLLALDLIIFFLLIPLWMSICHYILMPIEIAIKKFYMSKAKKKLASKNIIKIGITGSYGKTSVKNILKTILEKKYKVCATPKNYNTEMGATKTILENLDDHDVLICEMGARKKGDIEILTKLISPDYAIITPIGQCHLESFKSIENIESTKNELPLNMSVDGKVFFSGKSKSTIKLYKRFKGYKYLTSTEKGFAYAKNIKISCGGCEFDMVIDGIISHVKTKLLGSFNIDNILSASALAFVLGVSMEDIASAISSLEPTPHRLQLIEGKVKVLDDAYNSNEQGFIEALKVLNSFEGRKIVITPGIVELGSMQNEVNFSLGGEIGDCADFLVIMNEVNKNELLSGAISHGMKKENIFFADSRRKQKEIIQKISTKDSVILFENDLPDNYQ